jgi:hypothetical protein
MAGCQVRGGLYSPYLQGAMMEWCRPEPFKGASRSLREWPTATLDGTRSTGASPFQLVPPSSSLAWMSWANVTATTATAHPRQRTPGTARPGRISADIGIRYT